MAYSFICLQNATSLDTYRSSQFLKLFVALQLKLPMESLVLLRHPNPPCTNLRLHTSKSLHAP